MLRGITAGTLHFRGLALDTFPFRVLQPLPDEGLFLTAHFAAGKLLKCRCDGIRVPVHKSE